VIELLGSLAPRIFNSSIYDYKDTVISTRNDDLTFRTNLNHGLSTLILVVNYNLKSCSFTKKNPHRKRFGKTCTNQKEKTEKTLILPFSFITFPVKHQPF